MFGSVDTDMYAMWNKKPQNSTIYSKLTTYTT